MLRYFLSTLVVLSFTSQLFAQSFSDLTATNGKHEHGGFGGFSIKSTTINNEASVLAGGKVAWLIDHTFYLGFSGYTLLSERNATNPENLQSEYLNISYGGLLLGNYFAPNSIIHLNAEILLGAGTLYFTPYSFWNYTPENEISTIFTHTYYFVSEFSTNVVFNITHHFHIEVGLSYRKALGLDLTTLPKTTLDGLSYTISFLFGKF
ncbi:MAG: hypothetical protein OEW60_05110 [Thiovulaceae bacterium]|nr:hypothetical protein [Sulfurimonadaceae bacterium]